MGDDETVSVTFSASSAGGRLSFSRTLPNDGSAGRGFMKSSNSLSFSSLGLHLEPPSPVGEVGVSSTSVLDGVAVITGVSSKLTRTLFFFFPDPPSDVVEEVSLGAPLVFKRPFWEAGRDTEGEDFRADLAGEMDRAGGWCLTPDSSTATGAKCALRPGLRLFPRSCCTRAPPRPCPVGVFVVDGAAGVARRGYALSWLGALGETMISIGVGW